MKKISKLICLFSISLFVFAQFTFGQHEKKISQNGIDFVILEMKLGAILGGFKDGKFVDAETASKGAKVGEEYTLFGLNVSKNKGILKLTKVNKPDLEICPDYYSVETKDYAKSGVALSSNARWNATPRIPKTISPSSTTYRRIVRNFLRSKGISKPNVKIQKIYRVDLEGDGTDEVLIQATNRPDNRFPSVKRGDYSIVMLRKIVAGKVKNILVTGEIHMKTTDQSVFSIYELSSILDLDSDGKMEAVTYGSYHEGAWVEAFKVKKDGKLKKLLETGCGV